jgi:hypothetical protein
MKESDWKAFRKMVPGLRERYLRQKNVEITGILQTPGICDTERFWNAHEKITKEAKILERCLDDHSRSRMMFFIDDMLAAGMMTEEDLSVFSEELQAQARRWLDHIHSHGAGR